MTTNVSLHKVDAYWSEILGVSSAEWLAPGLHIVHHATTLADFQGVYVVQRGETVIVSVPARLVEDTIAGLANCDLSQPLNAAVVSAIYGDAVERTIGPAWISYADATDFRATEDRGARLLLGGDQPMLRMLAEACSADEWEHSGIAFDRPPIFGCFVGGRLAAASSYARWGQDILHVGVVTHPDLRYKGLGRAVASLTTAHGLAEGGIMQWQTLGTNRASLAVGHALGYRLYLETLSIRFQN